MNVNKNAPSNCGESEEALVQERHKGNNFIQMLKEEIKSKSEWNNYNKYSFPTVGLPQVILDFASEIANVYGVPIEFPALSALCAVSAAIRKKFNLDSGKYINFGQLWIMFVAPPGVGKTEPVASAFRPLQKIDNKSYEQYLEELSNWKNENAEAKANKLVEPNKPVFKQCLIDDFTPESLYQTMSRNNGAITLYRDELSGWFADFGRYSKNGEVSRYLSIFNNSQFCINRKSEEPIQIPEPFMSICGTIQPEILNDILNCNNLKDNGFASRFLYVYPNDFKKQKYSEKIPNAMIVTNYENLIYRCYNMPATKQPFTLSQQAMALFIDFANKNTDIINECTDNFIRATYSKMEIQVLRIALILHIIKSVDYSNEFSTKFIKPETMEYAIQLCYFFAENMMRVANSNLKPKINVVEAIKTIHQQYQIKNKQSFADAIGVSRQYISKICNE